MASYKYSIIILVYNTDIQLFKRALDSCKYFDQSQTEIIVYNDGSSKEFKYQSLINNYSLNIKYFNSDLNRGILLSRYLALLKSSGVFVIFLDSDDTLYEWAQSTIDKVTSDHPGYRMYSFASDIHPEYKTGPLSPMSELNKIIKVSNEDHITLYMWDKVFTRSFLCNVFYELDYFNILHPYKVNLGEDTIIMISFLNALGRRDKSMYHSNDIYYLYNGPNISDQKKKNLINEYNKLESMRLCIDKLSVGIFKNINALRKISLYLSICTFIENKDFMNIFGYLVDFYGKYEVTKYFETNELLKPLLENIKTL